MFPASNVMSCAGGSNILATLRAERRHLRRFAGALSLGADVAAGDDGHRIPPESLLKHAQHHLDRGHLRIVEEDLLGFLELHDLIQSSDSNRLQGAVSDVRDQIQALAAGLREPEGCPDQMVGRLCQDLSRGILNLAHQEERIIGLHVLPKLDSNLDGALSQQIGSPCWSDDMASARRNLIELALG